MPYSSPPSKSKGGRLSVLLGLIAFAMVLKLAGISAAQDFPEIEDYSITSWGAKDGLQSGVVWAIAQDLNGYLWLGTEGGLIRFDGVRFVPWIAISRRPLLMQVVQSLCVTKDGSLWVGYGEAAGGITRIKNDGLRHYGIKDGLGRGPILTIAEDSSGGVWSSGPGGVYHLVGNRWERLSTGGIDMRAVSQSIFFDQSGNLLIVTPTTILRRPRGQDGFQQLERSQGIRPLRHVAQDMSGALWVTDANVGFKRIDMPTSSRTEDGDGRTALGDRLGNLWIGTFGQGLWQVTKRSDDSGPTVRKITMRRGLSNDVVSALFEDRDGNIWAGTSEGLSRFTRHKVTPVTDVGDVIAMVPAVDGGLWVANNHELIRLSIVNGNRKEQRVSLTSGVRVLHVDRKGVLWIAGNRDVAYLEERSHRVVPLSQLNTPFNQIQFLTSDASNVLWISDGAKVYRWTDGHWHSVAVPDTDGTRVVVGMYADSHGRIGAAFNDGTVVVIDGESIKGYQTQDANLNLAGAAFFEDDRHVVWLGGFSSLSRFRNGRFETIGRSRGLPIGYVKAITVVGSELWLAMTPGIVRIELRAFDQVISQPKHQLVYRLYDVSDGLAGSPVFSSTRNVSRTSDGQLWFSTASGLTAIDPRAVPSSSRGEVLIESIEADREKVGSLNQVSLGPRTSTIEIAYTAVNLSAPHRLRFRYRLNGFDANWVEVGGRRTAYYTNLPAGTYQFEVMVQNEDGSWGGQNAPFAFVVQPTFYHTRTFYVLCASSVTLVGWGLWRLRLLRLRREFLLILRERLRLSREMHDTLLQGLVGVSLQLKGIANSAQSTPAFARLSRLQEQVEEHIRDTRRSISDLRSPLPETSDLPTLLRHITDTVAGADISIHYTVTGQPVKVSSEKEQELLRIAQEALNNAVRHANPHCVHVKLHYTKMSVTLTVEDDGHGFVPDAVPETGQPHHGLNGMRERAEYTGGSFRLTSTVGTGTRIQAVVPL